jgi:hypothetical protein
MAKIVVNLADPSVAEPKPVPVGMYDLEITSAEATNSQKGAPQVEVHIGIIGHEDAPIVRHYISLPKEGEEPGKTKTKLLFGKRFCALFKIPYDETGFDTDDFQGSKARCELTTEERDGNTYNKLNLPRLKDEGSLGVSPKTVAKPPKRG